MRVVAVLGVFIGLVLAVLGSVPERDGDGDVLVTLFACAVLLAIAALLVNRVLNKL